MRKDILIGSGCVALIAVAAYSYLRVSPPPPAPKDLTKIFPRQLLEKATSAQLAVLRGEAPAAPAEGAAPGAPAAEQNATTIPGLKLTLVHGDAGQLRASAFNATDAAVTWAFPAGTLLSNGNSSLVVLRDVSAAVPAKATVVSSVPVALTSAATSQLDGFFTPADGSSTPDLAPLLKLLAHRPNASPGAIQTAVLAVSENVPLDSVSNFPQGLRPPNMVGNNSSDLHISTADIIGALSLLREAGYEMSKLALAGGLQLEILAMLDPQSHAAAKEFFKINDQQEWGFWRDQLLHGDPVLRHYALYGIARYYPDVALTMMPIWVRRPEVSRSYRISAAWALALIDDPRARDELVTLRDELKDDAGLRQALDRALHHWGTGTASGNVKPG